MMLTGEAGARLVHLLSRPRDGTSLFRLLSPMRLDRPAGERLGMDDWAWRRGQRSGTLIVDPVSHRRVDVLGDRIAEAVTIWLQARPAGCDADCSRSCLGLRAGLPCRASMLNRR